MKKPLIAAAVAIVLAIAGAAWWLTRSQPPGDTLTLYGNVDIRQVALAFDNSERIADMQVEEGDRVRAGQVLARQQTRTLQLEAERAQARASAQEQALLRLRNGSRPQEIAQARARADAATADAALAQQDLQRLQGTARATDGRAVSRQDIDRAAARLRVARAQAETQAKALQLALLGPRDEDIAEATAQWQASQAELALLRHRLAQAELKAPTDAVVRARLLEPGDMASPQRPVYTLALTDPKWVRAYLSEPDLGRVRPGMRAQVYTDSQPDRAIDGQVGYISSVAEFTPKTVQTETLRTSLVYEIRIRVDDPGDQLRLGMPATVRLDLADAAEPGP